ncbi:MAG: heme biosynthesis HemY N-terminal domain-containing protein [Gammaproteobacteria bacterium]|jgi:HemY protein
MKLLIYIAILLLAILIGLLIKVDPGYVLIAYNKWTAEMPLWFAIAAIVIIFLLFHYSIRIWIAIANIGERWHIWKIKRHFYREHPLTNRGFMDLITENWENLSKSLPQLKKLRLLTNDVYIQLETKIYSQLLSKQNSLHGIRKIWRNVPSTLHKNPKIICAYAASLLKLQQDTIAASMLEKGLKSTWDESMVHLYGLTKTKHPLKQLKILENFISHHRHNPELLLALGRIATQCKLWAKADEYLHKYLQKNSNPNAYALLGYIYEQQGEENQALDIYRKGVNSPQS